jgi:CheY-like chemotaxis protein
MTQPHALAVDDDAIILCDAGEILNQAGFVVLTAMTGEAALQLLEQHAGEVAVLFTDVEMGPGMNGFELAWRAAQRWPEVGILVASGHRTPAAGELPDSAVFINKPFSAAVVYDRLLALLPDGEKPDPLKQHEADGASPIRA